MSLFSGTFGRAACEAMRKYRNKNTCSILIHAQSSNLTLLGYLYAPVVAPGASRGCWPVGPPEGRRAPRRASGPMEVMEVATASAEHKQSRARQRPVPPRDSLINRKPLKTIAFQGQSVQLQASLGTTVDLLLVRSPHYQSAVSRDDSGPFRGAESAPRLVEAEPQHEEIRCGGHGQPNEVRVLGGAFFPPQGLVKSTETEATNH